MSTTIHRAMMPVSLLISDSVIPGGLGFGDGDSAAGLLDRLYLVDHRLRRRSGEGVSVAMTLALAGECALTVPGFDAASFVIGEASTADEPFTVYLKGEVNEDGTWSLTLYNITVGIRFSPSLLKPTDGSDYASITATGSITLDQDLNLSVDGFDSLTLSPCEIGETGIGLSAAGMALLTSGGQVTGFSIGQAILTLPADKFQTTGGEDVIITLDEASFSNRGFSGTVSASSTLELDVGGFTLVLSRVEAELRENVVVNFCLTGSLTVPFMESALNLELYIGQDGDFSVALQAEDAAGVEIPLGPFLFTGRGVELGSADGEAYLSLDGSIGPNETGTVPFPTDTLSLPTIEVTDLRIGSDGSVAVPGGWLRLNRPIQASIKNTFTMEITGAGFGTDEEGYRWVALDGSVALADPLPAGVSAEGLRIAWKGTEVRVSLDGIGVEFTIPGAVSCSAYVNLNPDAGAFAGSADIEIIPVGLGIEGQLIVGKNESPEFDYCLVSLSMDLPVGVPLGSTGLAFYTFGGSFIRNMTPDLGASDSWLAWYQGLDQGNPLDGWDPEQGAFGIGARTVVGTLPDNGFTAAVEAGITFLLPGPVIVVDGNANILKARAEVEDSALATALAVLDAGTGEVLLNLSASYTLSGVLTVEGTAEAYFRDQDNWHVYVGTESEPIRASLLGGIAEGESYLMLEPEGIGMGASIGLGDEWHFGPVDVTLKAWMEGSGVISWEPQHYGADLELGGEFSIGAAGLDLGLAVAATVEAQSPNDKYLKIDLEGRLELPWPLPDVEAEVTLEWSDETAPTPADPLLAGAAVMDYVGSGSYALTEASGRAETDPPDEAAVTAGIPMDGRPALVFTRRVKAEPYGVVTASTTWPDLATADPSEWSGAATEAVGEYKLYYAAADVRLDKWDADAALWSPVEFEALWQDDGGTKLVLYADSPFYGSRWQVTASGSGSASALCASYVDWFLGNRPDYPLGAPAVPTRVVVDFSGYALGEVLGTAWTIRSVSFASAASATVRSAAGKKGINLNVQPIVIDLSAVGPVSLMELDLVLTQSLKVSAIFEDGTTTAMTLMPGTASLYALPLAWQRVDKLVLGEKVVDPGNLLSLFRGLSYVSAAELEQQKEQAEAKESVEEAAGSWAGSGHTFEAETCYRIMVTTGAAYTGPTDRTATTTHTFYFKTDAPPDDLAPYVEEAVPQGGGRQVFRGYDLVVRFKENYMDEMYADGLEVTLLDSNGQEPAAAASSSGSAPAWAEGRPRAAREVGAYRDFLAASGYAVPAESDFPGNDELRVSLASWELEPERVYEAQISYGGPALYSLRFTTSRFAGFSELVGSFAGAQWEEEVAADALAALQTTAMAYSPGDGGEAFDQAYYEDLGLATAPAPGALEVRTLRSGGKAYGLILDLPEPVEPQRLAVSVTNTAGTAGFACIPNRDGSRLLILLPGSGATLQELPSDRYTLAMTYSLEVSGLPTLSREGASAPEMVTLELEF